MFVLLSNLNANRLLEKLGRFKMQLVIFAHSLNGFPSIELFSFLFKPEYLFDLYTTYKRRRIDEYLMELGY